MLSDRVYLSSAQARVEEIKGGSRSINNVGSFRSFLGPLGYE